MRVDKGIDSDAKFEALRKSIMEAEVQAPEQKVYGDGDNISCYVITPEGLKLGIAGEIEKKQHYNRWIYADTVPEYIAEAYWNFRQTDAWGSSVDFSDREKAYFSVNGKDVGLALIGQK